MKLAGWLLGAITIALFPNLSIIPHQISRHLDPPNMILTPNDPAVVAFRNQFLYETSQSSYSQMNFEQRMSAVDQFILQKILWKEDYSNWKVVGLLNTPAEVISLMSGDCQGQAAVTTSLLLSMGYEAWVVETPFHWWTHARDPESGRVVNLNVHGHAGNQGSVLPQPIDLVYTRIPASCSNCSSLLAYNQHSIRYIAPPHHAFMIAFTGAHIFVRSGLSLSDISVFTFVELTLILSIMLTLYSAYFKGSYDRRGTLTRFSLSLALSTFSILGMSFWTTIFYPVTLLHLSASVGFAFFFVPQC